MSIKRHPKSDKKIAKILKSNSKVARSFPNAINQLNSGIGIVGLSDHALKGNLKDYRECHLDGDVLMIYVVVDGNVGLLDITDHTDLKPPKDTALESRLRNRRNHLGVVMTVRILVPRLKSPLQSSGLFL